MGASLVGSTLSAEWAQRLTPTERLVLIAMAHTALDPGTSSGRPSCEYWGGHEVLMIIVLGDLPPRNSTAYSSGKKLIQRAVSALLREGAIELLTAGSRAHRARYKLTLGYPQAVDNVRILPIKGDTDVPQTGTQMSPKPTDRGTYMSQ